jgi:hypothetical protein
MYTIFSMSVCAYLYITTQRTTENIIMKSDPSYHSPSLFYLLTVGVEVVYFHLITLRHTRVSRTPLDKGLAHRRDLYLRTQTSMPPVGFKLMIPASAQLQTYASDGEATGIIELRYFGTKICQYIPLMAELTVSCGLRKSLCALLLTSQRKKP